MTRIISPTCQIKNLAAVYDKYFGSKNDGWFVEVGAHDGKSWSNTWGLACEGWTGLYYEPVLNLYSQCIMNHLRNEVLVVRACVGDYNGEVKLYLGDNPTIDEETVARSPWDSRYDPNNHVTVPIVTLEADLPTHEWPEQFDLLCVDVEGAELQVLIGIDLNHYQPSMLILETHENNPDMRKRFHVDAINDYMMSQPYAKIQADGLNTIYWRL